MPETKFIMVLGRVAGRNLTWVLLATKIKSLPFLGCSEKRKARVFFSQQKHCSFLDRCGCSSCARNFWAPGCWDSPEITPGHRNVSTAPGFLFWETRNHIQLPELSRSHFPRLSAIQIKSHLTSGQVQETRLSFSPYAMGDGRLRGKRRKEWKINTST